MNKQINREFYSTQFQKATQKLASEKKRIGWVSFLRLISMIIVVWMLIKLFKTNSYIYAGGAGIFIVFFFILVSFHKNLSDLIKKLRVIIKINEMEIKALDGDYSGFRNGSEFLNPEHEFTYDLDIFGEKSLYQYINRTCTNPGHKKLAIELIQSPKSKDEILDSQLILKELTSMPELLQEYRATGLLTENSNEEQIEIEHWADKQEFPLSTFSLIVVYTITALNLGIIVLSLFIPGLIKYLIISGLIGWLFYGFYFTGINKYHNVISRKQAIVSKYLDLSKILARSEFKNPELLRLRETSARSIQMLKQLDSLMNFFDTRLNILVGLVLNTIVLFDFHIILKLEKWKQNNKTLLKDLFQCHADFDVLMSKSIFTFNNPEFIWPEISAITLEAKSLGHPLIQANKRICNDLEIKIKEKVLIVTGANMAGKSTFLRTVGINLILAGAGFPVCAGKMTFRPEKIISGMRTTDSLAESESYFFAELKRLRRIVQGLEKGDSYFILLDEILKGTNSTDKHLGSEALLKQLTSKQATTIIATHDLKLGELAKSFPGIVRNYHFESLIKQNELVFDYKLRQGIAVNMNASFLMKKMGIIN